MHRNGRGGIQFRITFRIPSIRPKFNRPRSRFRPSIDCFRRCTREKQIFIVPSDGGNGFFPGEYGSRHFRGRGSEETNQRGNRIHRGMRIERERERGIEIRLN